MQTRGLAHRPWMRFIAATTLSIFALQVTGCESLFARDPVRDGFKSLVNALESEGSETQLKFARAITIAVENGEKILGAELQFNEPAPTDAGGAAKFAGENRSKIQGYMKDLEDGSTEIRKLVFEISKHAYEAKDPKVAAKDNALVYFALEFQRGYHRRAAETLTPYMVYSGSEALRDVPQVKALGQDVTASYFRHFGAQIVSSRDKQLVLTSLRELKKDGQVPESVELAVNQTQQALAAKNGQEVTSMRSTFDKLDQNGQAKLRESVQTLTDEFEQISFLYSPEQNLNIIFGILVFIGNLTWGLYNTLIGASMIVWAAAFSLTGLSQFPRFSIARNGYMIYVDVTGANPLGIYGKMSMGIWELDNGTSYRFASGHEGVHSIQSALLGPMYIPTVLFTYLISGFDRGFMEDWADSWASI